MVGSKRLETEAGAARGAAAAEAFCILILAVWVAACGGGAQTTEQAARDGILLMGNGAEPQSLDPHVITGIPESHIVKALFEGLTEMDPKSLAAIPAAAESWRVSPDQKIYTFRLREGARWSDGVPVKAEDFVFGWRRALEPSLASSYAYLLFCIRNAEAYNKGDLKDFGQVGVRAASERDLEVTLEAPTPLFLSMLNLGIWMPARRDVISKHGGEAERDTAWIRAGNLIGNGPFVLTQWEPDRFVEVMKNENYWDAGAIQLRGIRFFPVSSRQTEERMFRSGQLHVTENVPNNKIPVYQGAKDKSLRIDPYLGVYFYRFNVTRPPFDNPRVRRALAMAVDRESIVRNITRGGQVAAGRFVPPGISGYACDAAIPFDPKAAKALLAEAGFPDGRGLTPIELLYNTDENHKAIAEAVQQMWKQSLNVDVTLVNQDWKVYLTTVERLDYSMARGGWIGDYVDPGTFLECWTTQSGNNRSGYSSAAYDAQVAKAAGALDGQARFAAYSEAERILLEDAPCIPIYFYTRVYLLSPLVRGWRSNPLGLVAYKQIFLTDVPEGMAGGNPAAGSGEN